MLWCSFTQMPSNPQASACSSWSRYRFRRLRADIRIEQAAVDVDPHAAVPVRGSRRAAPGTAPGGTRAASHANPDRVARHLATVRGHQRRRGRRRARRPAGAGSWLPASSRAECMESWAQPTSTTGDAEARRGDRADGRAAGQVAAVASTPASGTPAASQARTNAGVARRVGGVALVGVDLDDRAARWAAAGGSARGGPGSSGATAWAMSAETTMDAARARCRSSGRPPRGRARAARSWLGGRGRPRRWCSRCRSPRGRTGPRSASRRGQDLGRGERRRPRTSTRTGCRAVPSASSSSSTPSDGRRGEVVEHDVPRDARRRRHAELARRGSGEVALARRRRGPRRVRGAAGGRARGPCRSRPGRGGWRAAAPAGAAGRRSTRRALGRRRATTRPDSPRSRSSHEFSSTPP